MGKALRGNPVSPGVARAEAYHYEPLVMTLETGCFKAGKETEYWKAFREAHARTKEELQRLQEQVSENDAKAASIFAGHVVLLEDEDLMYEIRNAMLNDRMFPEFAIEACFTERVTALCEVEDELIAERIADILDVKRRLLRNYLGKAERNLSQLEKDVIVVAQDLMPSDVATLDRTYVKGIITEQSATNSHAVIIARSYQIPMVTGVENAMEEIAEGSFVEIDGEGGMVVADVVKAQ
ncbi:MAG: hypothetical protein IJZ23_02735 [Roseburia sp.]|nr:hypothetical protein [Roseburia sp.]